MKQRFIRLFVKLTCWISMLAGSSGVVYGQKLVDRYLYYDMDGDGIKELFELSGRKWSQYKLKSGQYILEKETKIELNGTLLNPRLFHITNDGIPDLGITGYDYYEAVALSQSDGTYKTINNVGAYPLDVNADGRKDLFSSNTNNWNIHYQTLGGSFIKIPIDTISRFVSDSTILTVGAVTVVLSNVRRISSIMVVCMVATGSVSRPSGLHLL